MVGVREAGIIRGGEKGAVCFIAVLSCVCFYVFMACGHSCINAIFVIVIVSGITILRV